MRPSGFVSVALGLFAALAATSAHATAPRRALSVMAYNVLYDATDVEATLKTIERADPDVLCLTELTPKFVRAFEDRFGDELRFRSFHPKSGTWGVGIASRFPLKNVTVFQQRPHRMPAVEARVVTDQGRVRVACLHLFPPVSGQKKGESFSAMMKRNADLRKKQAAFVVRRYAKEKQPVLLLGDMNEGSDERAMRLFAEAGYRRSCELPEQRCGPTFPGATSAFPAVWEVDHILGRDVRFESARVIKAGGSDHYPVFATFTLGGGEEAPPSSRGSSPPPPPRR
ncbi:MAG: endonuclease/exonuclease/phosphatase family protein [Myxococcaceae bacterium]